MSLKQEIFRIKFQFVETLYVAMEKIATWFFGYPNVTGMKIKPHAAEKVALINHIKGLPVHETRCPLQYRMECVLLTADGFSSISTFASPS